MQSLTFEDLVRASSEFDAAVRRAPEIDRFCSSTDWVLPAAETLMPRREAFLFRDGDEWIAMMRGQHAQGWRYLEPLEASWGLACPIISDDPGAMAERFIELIRRREPDWEVMLMSGLQLGSRLHVEVTRRLSNHYEVVRQSTTERHVAYLTGGLDGFLGRRSRNFRRALAKADRRAARHGVTFEPCHVTDQALADDVFGRIQAVENRSWKGMAGVGINVGSFGEFYRVMVRRLASHGSHRTWFARHEDRDVGYVLGGVLGASYRGLQMSFDERYRNWGLGNLCQLRQIEELCDQQFETYDLGTGLDYKHRWAEAIVESDVLIVIKM